MTATVRVVGYDPEAAERLLELAEASSDTQLGHAVGRMLAVLRDAPELVAYGDHLTAVQALDGSEPVQETKTLPDPLSVEGNGIPEPSPSYRVTVGDQPVWDGTCPVEGVRWLRTLGPAGAVLFRNDGAVLARRLAPRGGAS